MSYLWKFSEDEQRQILEEAREKNRMDQLSREHDRFNEGEKKGRREGLQEGERKGRREGRQEGRQEGRKEERQEVILKMLEKKADTSFIAEVTGLSEEEINKLKNDS